MADPGIPETQSFYGRWADLYDWLATAPGVGSWRERAVEALDLGPGDTVVEMGCGSGANLRLLRERVGPSGSVVAVDVTRPMLEIARELVATRGWENVHCLQADAAQSPIARDAEVDAVLATFVVGMFESPGAVVEGWCDLVGPGGRVALLNFQRSDALAAVLVNLAVDALVWLASPRKGVPGERPGKEFQWRLQAGREALARRTVDRQYETFGGGYLGLVAGRVDG
jgi:ubiquinone/menaquinone biosynthesis C-methylase UbiE